MMLGAPTTPKPGIVLNAYKLTMALQHRGAEGR